MTLSGIDNRIMDLLFVLVFGLSLCICLRFGLSLKGNGSVTLVGCNRYGAVLFCAVPGIGRNYRFMNLQIIGGCREGIIRLGSGESRFDIATACL